MKPRKNSKCMKCLIDFVHQKNNQKRRTLKTKGGLGGPVDNLTKVIGMTSKCEEKGTGQDKERVGA